MRLIKTYLLRLYTDSEVTERICGDIRPVAGKHKYPFKNANEFSNLLQRLAGEPEPSTPAQTGAGLPEKDDP
jgi:hypothetical protein